MLYQSFEIDSHSWRSLSAGRKGCESTTDCLSILNPLKLWLMHPAYLYRIGYLTLSLYHPPCPPCSRPQACPARSRGSVIRKNSSFPLWIYLIVRWARYRGPTFSFRSTG